MSINWKVRFKNPVWLTAFVTFLISTTYQLLAMFGVVPAVAEEAILQAVAAVVQLLTLAGILVDPTTQGLSDSERALEYQSPQ